MIDDSGDFKALMDAIAADDGEDVKGFVYLLVNKDLKSGFQDLNLEPVEKGGDIVYCAIKKERTDILTLLLGMKAMEITKEGGTSCVLDHDQSAKVGLVFRFVDGKFKDQGTLLGIIKGVESTPITTPPGVH